MTMRGTKIRGKVKQVQSRGRNAIKRVSGRDKAACFDLGEGVQKWVSVFTSGIAGWSINAIGLETECRIYIHHY